MRTEIQKGKGIEGLVRHVPVDEVMPVEVEPEFTEVTRLYEERLNYNAYKLPAVLAPEQINLFLQTTINQETHKNYYDCTGYFISSLIQASYNYGHNDFTLDTTALSVWELTQEDQHLTQVS